MIAPIECWLLGGAFFNLPNTEMYIKCYRDVLLQIASCLFLDFIYNSNSLKKLAT